MATDLRPHEDRLCRLLLKSMRNLVEISGPEVDDQLKESLQRWGFDQLTDVQQRALEAGVASGQNLVVCAPTSSGKTLVGEIALLQALRRQHRCLYLVSHKALADQKYTECETQFSSKDSNPSGTVGLSTGDREEGNLQADILIATYEKGLVLVLTGQIDPGNSVVVADELQIIGEASRGPNIEILCGILRQRGMKQFLALSATVENPDDLAAWMCCSLVQSHTRDVDLRQEIWYQGVGYGVTFGQEVGEPLNTMDRYPGDTLNAIDDLLKRDRAPILVFTESRREASNYARDFARHRQRHASGIEVAEQLDLFSEPTEGSENLQNAAERRVALHSADLTPQERQVIEQGFLDGSFDVCFATSTLAAGVNFPFKTVIFPKLTYQYGERQGTRITRGDYRNMSGRAGRLGMHDVGYAVLLPKNTPEGNHANELVLPDNDLVYSQLATLSMRRAVLTLVAAGVVGTKPALREFFENTYYWHLILERNPAKLDKVIAKAEQALDWLVDAQFADPHHKTYLVTPLGQATARSGLLPPTALAFVTLLKQHAGDLAENFDKFVGGLIHWVCCSDEFNGQAPSRFLPYPIGGLAPGSSTFVAGQQVLCPLDRNNSQLCQSVHALILFVQGIAERKIFHLTNMSSGSVHRLAMDVSWILNGCHSITAVPDLACPQQVGNQFAMLARRVRWGSPAEALDLIRIAERARVPGFGRQRAMALVANGGTTFEEIEDLGAERVSAILRSHSRAEAFFAAISEHTVFGPNRLASGHDQLAKRLGVRKMVAACAKSMDREYEKTIVRLLRMEMSWAVTVLDDGRRQNVPDVLLKLGDIAVLLEMKTASKSSGLIKKEAAFAVLQKAADYSEEMARVTLGKPHFDEMSKSKVAASRELTLVEHVTFVEALLRVLAGEIESTEFLAWLTEPGEAEFERIPGKPTYLLT